MLTKTNVEVPLWAGMFTFLLRRIRNFLVNGMGET